MEACKVRMPELISMTVRGRLAMEGRTVPGHPGMHWRVSSSDCFYSYPIMPENDPEIT